MIWLNDWCDIIAAEVGAHGLRILTARKDDLPFAQHVLAAAVPGHYASEESADPGTVRQNRRRDPHSRKAPGREVNSLG